MNRSDRKCAKWCGRGCTVGMYLDAKEKGAALAKKLGKGWKPRIFENLGWHYEAVDKSGFWKVHATSPGCPADSQYIAYLGGLFHGFGGTPKSAIENTIEVFREQFVLYHRLDIAADLALKSCERR